MNPILDQFSEPCRHVVGVMERSDVREAVHETHIAQYRHVLQRGVRMI